MRQNAKRHDTEFQEVRQLWAHLLQKNYGTRNKKTNWKKPRNI